jgi:NADH dehydrogenase/NADH:ubiquinone oxidoreductase subunit G
MTVSIRIDGRPLNVAKGLTILQAARQNEIYIPTLCDFPGLPPHGGCRMCIVEIQGKAVTPTACTALVEDNMQIETNSPKIRVLRNELLLMLLADHPSSCLFCPEQSHCDECMVTLRKAGVTTGCRSCAKDGQCGLQEMVAKFGLSPIGVDLRVDPLHDDPGRTHRCAPTAEISDGVPTEPLPIFPPRYRMLPVKKDDPFFDRDYNLCVLCGRCIRTCTDLHFASALAYTKRGSETVVGTAFNRSQIEAGCSFCGTCVEACPTGALSEKTRKWDGAPQAATETTCPLCSIGCSIRLLSKDGRVIGSLPNHAAGSDALCVKGRFGMVELLNHPSRLKQPQKNTGAYLLDIPWEEALHLAAEKCAACPPDKFAVVVSASGSSEELYLAQKLAQKVTGAPRIYAPDLDCYGDGLGLLADLLQRSQPISTIDEASHILCLGLDGKYAQSVVEVKLHQAKKRGARLVTVYPEEHSLGMYADEWDRLVVIVGPDFLTQPDSAAFLQSVATLLDQTGAKLILLPEHANLAGALRLGVLPASALPDDLAVLYLIGENLPAKLPGNPFVLYQNLYPPSDQRSADLLLPMAAFSETTATIRDAAGRAQTLRQAVPPPGEALPSWQIVARIAQHMGLSGFDYPDLSDLQTEEIAQVIFPVGVDLRVDLRVDPGRLGGRPGRTHRCAPTEGNPKEVSTWQNPLSTREPAYLGFPLSHWVEGLRTLSKNNPSAL